MTSLVRGVAGVVLAAYVVAIAAVLLAADSAVASEVIARAEAWLDARGAPAWVTYGERVQLMLNAAMFAPITCLAAVVLPRHPWGNWVAYAFICSGVVEVVQAFVLESREAEYVDVVANTLGGLVGALVSIPLVVWLRRVSGERSG